MRVISRRALREFWEIHPTAREPLGAWYRLMDRGEFADFAALRKTFGAADRVAPYTIFDVGGFRVIAAIHYNRKRAYVRYVFTHSEYDAWSDRRHRERKGKG